MNLELHRPPLPRVALAAVVGLFALSGLALLYPLPLSAAGAAALLGSAITLATSWRRSPAAPGHAAFIGT